MSGRGLPALSGEAGLSRYLTEIRKFPLLTPEDEFMFAKRWQQHEDPEAARMMGVEVDQVVMSAFFLGSALAGASGMIFGLYYNLAKVDIGFASGLRAFTAAVLGGIGNVPGAMLGGVLIGLIESASGQLVGTAWSDVVIFGILVLVLVFRPAGLLGRLAPNKS